MFKVLSLCQLLCIVIAADNLTDVCFDNQFDTDFETRGCIFVDRNASLLTHYFDVQSNSSLIRITLYQENSTVVLNGTLTVHIEESIRATTWRFLPGQQISNNSYVSITQSLNVRFTYEGEWTDLILMHKELDFKIRVYKNENDSGILYPDTDFSEPNTMTVYKILPKPNVWNESSVTLLIHRLRTDDLVGDYMLIGAGKAMFDGPPAAILTHITEPKKYYIENDVAYIALFHTSEQEPDFEIEWIRIGSRITVPDKEKEISIPNSVRQAVPICFYNQTWITEFGHKDSSPLSTFKKKFTDVANLYIRKKRIEFVDEIKPSSVRIVRISTTIPPRKNLPHGAIYALITIVQSYDTKQPVFQSHRMAEIVETYDTYDEANGYDFGFKIGKCPPSPNYNWWYAASALLFIFSTAFFVGVWICAYNSVWKSKRLKKGSEVLTKRLSNLQIRSRKSRDLNHIGYANPIITITDEEGHNINLSNGPTQYTNVQSDEDSETEVYSSNWIMKRKDGGDELTENNDVPTSQIHMFKSTTFGEKIGTSNLVWLKDKIGDSFASPPTVKLDVHEHPDENVHQPSRLTEETTAL